MTERELIIRAARVRKVQKLRANPMMDGFAVKLNAEPTYAEQQEVERMWRIFKTLGAQLPMEKQP